MGAVGQFAAGAMSGRYGSKKIAIVTSIGIFFGLLLLLLIPATPIAVILFVVVYGISVFGNQPPIGSLIAEVSPEAYVGATFGLTFFLSFGLGSVSTAIAGYFADHYSLAYSYLVMTVVALVAVVMSLFLPEKKKQSDHRLTRSERLTLKVQIHLENEGRCDFQ